MAEPQLEPDQRPLKTIPWAQAAPGFYVTAVEGPRFALVGGPYDTLAAGEAALPAWRDAWCDVDLWAYFALWGVCEVVR